MAWAAAPEEVLASLKVAIDAIKSGRYGGISLSGLNGEMVVLKRSYIIKSLPDIAGTLWLCYVAMGN